MEDELSRFNVKFQLSCFTLCLMDRKMNKSIVCLQLSIDFDLQLANLDFD